MVFILTLELEGSQFDPVGRHKKQLQSPVYFFNQSYSPSFD